MCVFNRQKDTSEAQRTLTSVETRARLIAPGSWKRSLTANTTLVVHIPGPRPRNGTHGYASRWVSAFSPLLVHRRGYSRTAVLVRATVVHAHLVVPGVSGGATSPRISGGESRHCAISSAVDVGGDIICDPQTLTAKGWSGASCLVGEVVLGVLMHAVHQAMWDAVGPYVCAALAANDPQQLGRPTAAKRNKCPKALKAASAGNPLITEVRDWRSVRVPRRVSRRTSLMSLRSQGISSRVTQRRARHGHSRYSGTELLT